MADTNIRINTQVIDDQVYMKAFVELPAEIPEGIWMYENTGTDQLGDWVGVCTLDELTSTQLFTGTPIPPFGNKYVRFRYAELFLPYNVDASQVVSKIISSVSLLRREILAGSGGTSVLYPVT